MGTFKAVAVIASIAVGVAACASPEDMGAIESTADEFYTRLAAGDAKAIHETAAEAYRQTTSFEQSERLVAFFKPRLESCEAPIRIKNNVTTNYSTAGNFITVVYQRQCPLGPVTETLTFQVKDNVATLAGFNISGDQLMTEPPSAPETAPTSPPADANPPI